MDKISKKGMLLVVTGIVCLLAYTFFVGKYLGYWDPEFSICSAPALEKANADKEVTSCAEFWFNRYQTLTGALVAILAASLAWVGVMKQVRVAQRQTVIIQSQLIASIVELEKDNIEKLRPFYEDLADIEQLGDENRKRVQSVVRVFDAALSKTYQRVPDYNKFLKLYDQISIMNKAISDAELILPKITALRVNLARSTISFKLIKDTNEHLDHVELIVKQSRQYCQMCNSFVDRAPELMDFDAQVKMWDELFSGDFGAVNMIDRNVSSGNNSLLKAAVFYSNRSIDYRTEELRNFKYQSFSEN